MKKVERLLEEILAELKSLNQLYPSRIEATLNMCAMELEKANEFNRRLVKILELVLVKEVGA